MRKALFNIDGGQVYVGYTDGHLWNGWATPYFTLEEARKIQVEWEGLTYDEDKDEFSIQYEDYDEPYIWKGEDHYTVDGKLHLYGVGAYSHIWDQLYEDDKRYLAQTVEEFLFDYDTYSYMDEYECREDVVEDIFTQLANLNTFAKAYTIMHNDHLTSDQIYIKLGEVLTI